MTKYEWERELRRNLAKLPADEVNRALSFYDELFADKAEQGYSEREVINEFGNPFDVANSIIHDYEAENGRVAEVAPPPPPKYGRRQAEVDPFTQNAPPQNAMPGYRENTGYNENAGYYANERAYNAHPNAYNANRSQSKGCLGAIMRLIFFVPYMVLIIVFGSLIIGFGASAVACIIGGLVYACTAFTLIAAGGGVAAVGFGTGLLTVGVGALFAITVPLLVKAVGALSKVYFGIRSRKFGYNTEGYRNENMD